MSILINTNIKREYMIIPIIPIGVIRNSMKTNLYITLLHEILMQKFLIKGEYKKRNMK